jgi:hypothetical protein
MQDWDWALMQQKIAWIVAHWAAGKQQTEHSSMERIEAPHSSETIVDEAFAFWIGIVGQMPRPERAASTPLHRSSA